MPQLTRPAKSIDEIMLLRLNMQMTMGCMPQLTRPAKSIDEIML